MMFNTVYSLMLLKVGSTEGVHLEFTTVVVCNRKSGVECEKRDMLDCKMDVNCG